METKEGRKITRRFFEALRELMERGTIRGKQTFTRRYGINRWNLIALEQGRGNQKNAQLDWLTYLVRDYDVSAEWLLTGEGPMFVRRRPRKVEAQPEPEEAEGVCKVNEMKSE